MCCMSATSKLTEKGFPFFRMKVIKLDKVERAIKHNRRAIPAELDGKHSIDPSRIHLNYHLHGRATAQDVFYEWNGFYIDETEFDSKPKRKDAVWLNEIIMSVSASDNLAQDIELLKRYFTDALEWLKTQFKAHHIISFDVHMDEANPHAHALILPISNGKMNGSEINKPLNQKRLRLSFVKEVGAKYGYKTKIVRLNPAQKEEMYSVVMNELTHNPKHSGLINSPLFDSIRDNIRADPQHYFVLLGLDTRIKNKSAVKPKHFVDIARSKGKGAFKK